MPRRAILVLLAFVVSIRPAASREPLRVAVRYLGVIDCDSVAQWRQDAFLACHSVGDQLPFAMDHSKRADAYVLRINLETDKLVYALRLGGGSYSAAFDIRTDAEANAYVVGSTQAPDFPTTPDAVQTKFGGGKSDAFLAIVSPDGKLRYSTFLGGAGQDEGVSLDRDENGRLFAGGTTWSPKFPGASESSASNRSRAFIARVDIRRGNVKSAVFGGGGDTWLSGLKTDGTGGVYATGTTHAPDFPVLHPAGPRLRGNSDAFLSRFNVDTLEMTFSTFFGGSGDDAAWGVAITAGDPVIAGATNSSDLPGTRHAFQKSIRGGKDVFIARFRRRDHNRPQATWFGGTLDDAAGSECGGCAGAGVAADASTIWIAGYSASGDLPLQIAPAIPNDPKSQRAFIAAFTPSLDRLCYGSYVDAGHDGALEGLSLSKGQYLLASGFSDSTDLQHAVIDEQSKISLRLNGRSAHAMLVTVDGRGACR